MEEKQELLAKKPNYKEQIANLEQEKKFLAQHIEELERQIVETKQNYEGQINNEKEQLKQNFNKQIEEIKDSVKKQIESQQKYITRRENELTSSLNAIDNMGKALDGVLYLFNYVKNDLIEKATKQEGDKK